MLTKSILIVEDDPDNKELLEEIISSCTPNYKYTSVEDGEEALNAAHSKNFDLVLMDMSLPKKDGYETLHCLRESEDYKTVPVVALTAHAMNGIREKILNFGFNEYISKPCKPKVLIDVILKYLEGKQRVILK